MDIKISDKEMQETITETKIITYNIEDLKNRKARLEEEIVMYTKVIDDIDKIIARCKALSIE